MNEQITMALATVRDAGSLPVTWNTIDECTKEVLSWKNTVGLGVLRIGQALNWAKAQLPHGEWTEWLTNSVDISQSSAQNFMRIAREVEEGSQISRLPYTKILALLDVPKDRRDQFAQDIDAEHKTVAEIRRLTSQLNASKAAARIVAEELTRTKDKLDDSRKNAERSMVAQRQAEEQAKTYREQLEKAQQLLAHRKEPETKVIEKVPDDYLTIKAKLAAAEKEADRLADELDRAKLAQAAAGMDGEDDLESRICAGIGSFMTTMAAMPQRIRESSREIDDEGTGIIMNQMTQIRAWCDAMTAALMDQPRFRG